MTYPKANKSLFFHSYSKIQERLSVEEHRTPQDAILIEDLRTAVKFTEERKWYEDEGKDKQPVIRGQCPIWRVRVWRGEVMIKRCNHVGHQALDNDEVTTQESCEWIKTGSFHRQSVPYRDPEAFGCDSSVKEYCCAGERQLSDGKK